MVAFSGRLHRAGMISRRLMLQAAWGQLIYAQVGATPEKLEKLRESVLALTTGWDQARDLRDRARDAQDVIEPIVFDEALDRIREHQAWGHKVFIVSASPEEIVAPLAQLLGVDEAIATRAELDAEGRYSGRDRALRVRPGEGGGHPRGGGAGPPRPRPLVGLLRLGHRRARCSTSSATRWR